jgi:hypothetical protein
LASSPYRTLPHHHHQKQQSPRSRSLRKMA